MPASSKQSVNPKLPFPVSRSHAFIVGIDNYQNVAPLQTAVNDARKLARVLSKRQHFRVYPPLLNATAEQINTLLKTTLPEKVKSNDRVFFYFAGHGVALNGDDGPAGFLVAADTNPLEQSTFVPMEALYQAINALPCVHLLLVLDCCFSGAFKWASTHRAVGGMMPRKIYKQTYDRFVADHAWQVITSAAYDQKAADILKGQEQAVGKRATLAELDSGGGDHSPFAHWLLRGLEGEADVTIDGKRGDGVITATELYAFIRDRLEPASTAGGQKRQTPGFFPLQKHDKGEFIFLHPEHPQNLPARPDRNPYMGLTAFDEKDKDLFYGRDRVIEELQARAYGYLHFSEEALGRLESVVIDQKLLAALKEFQGRRFVARNGMHHQFKRELQERYNIQLTADHLSLLKQHAQVERNRLLVVSGASGTGKSSVIKAGLLPALREEGYRILPVVRPGETPVETITKVFSDLQIYTLTDAALASLQEKGVGEDLLDELGSICNQEIIGRKRFDTVIDHLIGHGESEEMPKVISMISEAVEKRPFFPSPPSIVDGIPSAEMIKELKREPTVLLLDQFEELISRCIDDLQGDEYVRIIKRLLDETADANVLIVLTVRSDFEPQLDKGDLAEYWTNGRMTIPHLSIEEYREIILMPTIQEVLDFDPPELVDSIISEVVNRPGALPLLSFTLSELYKKAQEVTGRERTLSEADYKSMGGVMGALRTKADTLYEQEMKELGSEYQRTMERVVLRMVSPSSGELASRRVSISELDYGPANNSSGIHADSGTASTANNDENRRIVEVIERLIEARLIVKGIDQGVEYIEPAHDALVRAWGTLLRWVRRVGDTKLLLRGKVTEAAREFVNHSEKATYLWHNDPRLDQLKVDMEGEDLWFNREELDFFFAEAFSENEEQS